MTQRMTKHQHRLPRRQGRIKELILGQGMKILIPGLLLGLLPWHEATTLGQELPLLSTSFPAMTLPQDDWPLLKPGDEGEAVRQLQTALGQLGVYDGPVDGLYSDRTRAAVEAFQQQNGLGVDGLVGPETWGQIALHRQSQDTFRQMPRLQADNLSFTRLTVAQPAPPPSPWWLAIMPAIPLLGGALTYLQHRYQKLRP